MTMKRIFVLAGLAVLASYSLLFGQKPAAPAAPCDAPSYFGMCNPYVPGIIARSAPHGGVLVVTAWPSGPADQAGLCPGDQFVSVNGIAISGLEFMEILKLIVSDTSTPIDLTIKRGDQNLSFHLARAKETELVALSHEKFTHMPLFPDGEPLVTVPLDESAAELQAFKNFELEVGRRNGFKLADRQWVPLATDEGQFARLDQVLNDPMSSRLAKRVDFPTSAYHLGFSAAILQHPDQVLVYFVFPAFPALKAGLLPGDEIMKVDGHPVSGLSKEQLNDLVLKPDDHARDITLRIRSGAVEQTIKIETQKSSDIGYFNEMRPKRPDDLTLGFQLVDLTNPQEMVVREVAYPSAAFAAGMHVGDAILAVNGRPVKQITREPMEETLYPSTPTPLRIDALRLGKKIHFELTPMTEAQAQASIGRKMTAHGPASTKCTEASQ